MAFILRTEWLNNWTLSGDPLSINIIPTFIDQPNTLAQNYSPPSTELFLTPDPNLGILIDDLPAGGTATLLIGSGTSQERIEYGPNQIDEVNNKFILQSPLSQSHNIGEPVATEKQAIFVNTDQVRQSILTYDLSDFADVGLTSSERDSGNLTNPIGHVFRWDPITQSGYALVYQRSGTLIEHTLYRFDNGIRTVLGTSISPIVSNFEFTSSIQGNLIQNFINHGSPIISISDNTYQSGKIGVIFIVDTIDINKSPLKVITIGISSPPANLPTFFETFDQKTTGQSVDTNIINPDYYFGIIQPGDKNILQRIPLNYDTRNALNKFQFMIKPSGTNGIFSLLLAFYSQSDFTLNDFPSDHFFIDLYGQNKSNAIDLRNELSLIPDQWNIVNLDLKNIIATLNIDLLNSKSLLLGFVLRGSISVRISNIFLVRDLI